jgi:hypothetical protein
VEYVGIPGRSHHDYFDRSLEECGSVMFPLGLLLGQEFGEARVLANWIQIGIPFKQRIAGNPVSAACFSQSMASWG